jgi:uncharacterized protein YceH (UPF0502 family)
MSIGCYTVTQRWMRRHGILGWVRLLGWAPVRDVQVALAERDMNIRERARLEDRIERLEQQIAHLKERTS